MSAAGTTSRNNKRGPAKLPSSSSSNKKAGGVKAGGVTSLAPFLRFLVESVGVVVVELKNGKCIRGTLDSADDYMNLTLTKPPNNDTKKQPMVINPNIKNALNDDDDDLDFSRVHIRGPSIRYVHLPSHADIPQLIRNGLDRERAASDRYQRGKRTKR
eukprot:scaffold21187_cov54-Attheya_sp.AAC.4